MIILIRINYQGTLLIKMNKLLIKIKFYVDVVNNTK